MVHVTCRVDMNVLGNFPIWGITWGPNLLQGLLAALLYLKRSPASRTLTSQVFSAPLSQST